MLDGRSALRYRDKGDLVAELDGTGNLEVEAGTVRVRDRDDGGAIEVTQGGGDIPIGLIDGSRKCDIEARAALICRKSGVFPAPYH
ncbi:MAG: hypothetical protein R2848_03675 [Thermomicrobiales bacterium]